MKAWKRRLLFAAGAACLMLPVAMQSLQAMDARRQIESREIIKEQENEKILAEARAWNETLKTTGKRDGYENVLDPYDNGIMGYLTIPKIDLELPIYHGTSDEVLDQGVGHLEYTALPVGSVGMRPVLSAHRGRPGAELFTRLDEMEEGDLFSIETAGKTLNYQVTDIRVIKPEETDALAADPEKDQVTLLTCTPYGINSHRLLVTGTATNRQAGSAGFGISWRNVLYLLIPTGLGLVWIISTRKRKETT